MNFSNFLSAITGDTIFMIVLVVVVLLFLIVFPMFTNKRRQKQVEKLQEGVVVGGNKDCRRYSRHYHSYSRKVSRRQGNSHRNWCGRQ